MRSFQSILDDTTQDAPKQLLAKIIDEKLAEQKLSLNARERQLLLDHITSGASGTLQFRRWQWWGKRHINLNFDHKDAARFERLTDNLVSEIPNIIADVTDKGVELMLSSLLASWKAESRLERGDVLGFRRRLADRWGEPFELLRLMHVLAREYGEAMGSAFRTDGAGPPPHLREALSRLHARSCRLAAEILALSEAGFPEGALARWRVLHEVATVAMFLSDHDEQLAERYILHVHIEEERAATEYRTQAQRLGLDQLSLEEYAALQEAGRSLVDRFGKHYGEPYGWAAGALGLKRPKFADIERSVGLDHLRPFYRLASHSIHANPKGIYFHLGLIGYEDVLLAGPSNTGLSEPIRYAAASLSLACVALLKHGPTLDHIIWIGVLSRLSDQIVSAVEEVEASIATQSV